MSKVCRSMPTNQSASHVLLEGNSLSLEPRPSLQSVGKIPAVSAVIPKLLHTTKTPKTTAKTLKYTDWVKRSLHLNVHTQERHLQSKDDLFR